MADQFSQKEIDDAVAKALEAAQNLPGVQKATLFVSAGDKPAPVAGLVPAGTPEAVDTDYAAARKALSKAAKGEALDDMDKAALKAFDKKMDDDKKDDAEKAQKALVKSIAEAVSESLKKSQAARAEAVAGVTATLIPGVDHVAEMRKAFEARDAKLCEVITQQAEAVKLIGAQAKAAQEAVASFAKGGNPGPKSGGGNAQDGGGVNADLARKVAQSDFHPRTIEKNVIADRICDLVLKGHPGVNRSDIGNFTMFDILRPEVDAALKSTYGV